MKTSKGAQSRQSWTHGLRWAISGLLGLMLVGAVSSASAQAKPHDWKGKDVKNRAVSTESYRGKVLLVFIASDETKDLMQPISERLVLRYGHNENVGQLTLADFSDAPFTWKTAESVSGTVTEKTAKAHDRTVRRIQGILKKNGQPAIPNLDKKIHIVIDWDNKIVKKYKKWDSDTYVTVVAIDQAGELLGSWKTGPSAKSLDAQLLPVFEAVDKVLPAEPKVAAPAPAAP